MGTIEKLSISIDLAPWYDWIPCTMFIGIRQISIWNGTQSTWSMKKSLKHGMLKAYQEEEHPELTGE